MNNKKRNSARKTNACLAILTLALLAPLGAALGETSGTTATSNATLQAFADGSVGKTLTFAAGANADSSVNLRLPRNATVAEAALDASVAGSSAVSSGAVVFDIGADGTADATASLSVLGKTRVTLPAAALNAYLAAHGDAAAGIDIPVKVTAAAASTWSIVLDGLQVEYSLQGAIRAAPTFTGEIGAVGVVSGGENRSAIDLAGHFAAEAEGNLTFSAQLRADAQAAASGVRVVMNGSKVDIRAENADWFGEVIVKFAAVDAEGQVAFSNDVAVHVTPREVDVPTLRTEVQGEAKVVLVGICGAPAIAGSFEVPADAIVTQAKMSLQGGIGASVLGATVDILAGVEAVAGLELSNLPALVELNASALNSELRAKASSWGLVELDLALDVCPSGAVGSITVGNVSLTYTRGSVNASAEDAVIASIEVEGAAAARVDSDEALRFELATNGSLESGTQVEWFVDGKLVASGSVAEGVELCQGTHTVEARATTGVAVHAYRTTVNATSDAAAEAAIAFNGIVTTAVRSGTALIVELRTPERISAGAQVDWYVDGAFVGRGQVLADLTLAPGTHLVEARSTENGTVHSYAAQVTASPPAAAANLPAALLVTGAVALGALAIVGARRRRR